MEAQLNFLLLLLLKIKPKGMTFLSQLIFPKEASRYPTFEKWTHLNGHKSGKIKKETTICLCKTWCMIVLEAHGSFNFISGSNSTYIHKSSYMFYFIF